jgi:hypothetical protein
VKNYFTFSCNIAPAGGRRNYQFLFKSPGTLKEGDLADAIERSAGQTLWPDGIAIVCIEAEVDELSEALKLSSGLRQAMERLANKISLCVCSVDSGGKILFSKAVRNAVSQDKEQLHGASDRIFSTGLQMLFSAHHVLVSAPPGFSFVKPSGERSTQFLRTEDALNEIENVQFLSLALMSKVKRREAELKSHIEVIFIDSMAIASVAYALRDLYCSFFNAPSPRVVSFHSHDGLKDVDFPQFGTSLCIISASSSMRLQKLWLEKSRCHPAEVVTLLTMSNAQNAADALFAIDNGSQGPSMAAGLRDIRMTGERFAPEELLPKKILLRREIHFVNVEANHCSELFTGGTALTVQGRGPIATSKVRPIFINGEALAQHEVFKHFLMKILEQNVPASTKAIVHQDDASSLAIAHYCAAELQRTTGASAPLPLISQSQIDQADQAIHKTGALLIIAGVVGRGTKLLSISRDLRPKHTGARVYIIGAQISETKAQAVTLKRNLEFSATQSSILIFTFASAAIGASLPISYRAEAEAITNLRLESVGGGLAGRLAAISGSPEGVTASAVLPSGSSLETKQSLRPDFAFWKFKYEDREHNTPAVLLTVAAILQNARESTTMPNAHRLGTEAFQQVVLDPENFGRYNDGVIQAAILRAALPGELDYSSEVESSKYMLDLLSKVFTQSVLPQGEAAADFALAYYLGRLRLTSEHSQGLVEQVRSEIADDTPLNKLLRLLLKIDTPAAEAELPPGF